MPRKRKIKRRAPGGGRKPSKGTVRLLSIGKYHDTIRLSFSEDLIHRLAEIFNKRAPGMLPPDIPGLPGYDRYAGLRLLLEPPPDPSIPALMVQIEAPTYHSRGHRMWRSGRRFMVQAPARKLGLDEGLYASRLDYAFLEDALMLVVFFNPGDLRYEGAPKDARDAFGLPPVEIAFDNAQ